jgi:hypothetical protein
MGIIHMCRSNVMLPEKNFLIKDYATRKEYFFTL